MSPTIRSHIKNRKARAAIKQAVLALQKRNEREAAARASQRASRAADTAAIMEPVKRLVESDPAATKALARLRSRFEEEQKNSQAQMQLSKEFRPPPGTTVPLSLTLHEHIDFQFPPYDYEWSWGNYRDHLADKASGTIGVIGDSGNVSVATDAAVAAASGIGFVFSSDKPGSVVISPLVQHSWKCIDAAVGIGSWASAKGGIDASAWQGSTMVAGVRRTQLFSDSSGWAGGTSDSGGGYAWVPDLVLSFPIAAGAWYAVNFGAWVECDHAAGLGLSRAQGIVQGYVRWATVERFTQ
jgi:hypothetical protein